MQILLQTFGTIIITAIVIMFFIDDPYFRNWLSRRLGLQGDSKIVGPHSMKGSRAIVETIFLEEEGEITGYVWIEGERWKVRGDETLLQLQKGTEVVVKDVTGLVLEVCPVGD